MDWNHDWLSIKITSSQDKENTLALSNNLHDNGMESFNYTPTYIITPVLLRVVLNFYQFKKRFHIFKIYHSSTMK